jgi:ribosomal protein S18 acetylase RimI-like enzyme
VGIDPAHRGRGLGRLLVAFGLAEARRLGGERVELGVYAENTAARALYASFGFVEASASDSHGILTMARG